MATPSKFKTHNGNRYTRALFFEETLADKSTVSYTLKDTDHLGFPSLYRLYMEMEDLTEWEFANEYLDGYEHWMMLCECNWFKPFVTRWRLELTLKTKAKALRSIRATAEGESKNAYFANKFLLEGGWAEKSGPSRGRPSKAEVEKNAVIEAEQKLKISKDFERINLKDTSDAKTH